MDAIALHLEVRNALSLADELGRHEHALGNDAFAGQLAAVRSLLGELERDAGRSHRTPVVSSPALIERLANAVGRLRDRLDEVPGPLRPRIGQLLAALDRVVFAESRPNEQVPAKALFGALPVARIIPQDVHSAVDYATVAAYAASAFVAKTTRARIIGGLLAAKVGGVAATTDARMSGMKMVPIELHEGFDLVSGASVIAAPFLLGYLRKDPLASLLQIGAGVGAVLTALFTDYRADRGVGRALRSRGGPARFRRARRHQVQEVAPVAIVKAVQPVRVAEVQRPLEGLAGPSFLPSLDGDDDDELLSSRRP